ncbi:MAG: helix-turn-helix domain-containing protein [Dermatophilaceae bacterium]
MTIGQELRRARVSCGLTQGELARRAGLSVEGISLLERGRRSPRPSTMLLLVDAMGLSDRDRLRLLRDADTSGGDPAQLPAWPDPILGRETDVTALRGLLDRGARVVTITGPGGIGKTRLAAAAVTDADGQERVRWVRVGAIRHPDGWFAGVADALGFPEGTTLESIVGHLADRRLVLVLDNAERLLDRCRQLVEAVCLWNPHVQILVTSRQRLQVPGERSFPLVALRQPASPAAEAELEAAPATALFLRAMVRHTAEPLPPADVGAIARICRLVDGLPLAIELVAAHTDVYSTHELADAVRHTLAPGREAESDDGLGLRGGLLDDIVGWSSRSLGHQERELFAALSVFASAFRERAAQAVVCRDEASTRRSLAALLGASLITRGPDWEGQATFRMLHLVRAVARDLLAERDDAATIHRRHAELVIRAASAAAAELAGPKSSVQLRVLDAVAEDVDAAMVWAVADGAADVALRLAAAMREWCYLRGRYAQGRAWAAEALAVDARTQSGEDRRDLRAQALGAVGGMAFLQCDYAIASAKAEAAATLFRDCGNVAGEAWALGRLGSIARERGDYHAALERHTQARALFERAGDAAGVCGQLNAITLAQWLSGDTQGAGGSARAASAAVRPGQGGGEPAVWAAINGGVVARLRGELARADVLLGRALDLSQDQGFPEGIAWCLNQRGVVARLRGEEERAMRMQEASLLEHRRLGDRWRQASALEELALLAALTDDPERAARCLGEADDIRQAIGAPVPPAEADVRQHVVALLGG